jgi:hypothetical protein
MQAIPAIIALAGTAATMYDQHEQQKDRRKILNQQLEREDEATDKSVNLVNEEGQNYASKNRVDQMREAENKTFEQTQADIKGAGGGMVNTSTEAGNVSNDFLEAKAQATIDEGSRLTEIAREAAKARAPGVMRMDDSLRMAGLTGNLANVWGGVKNMHRAAGLDAGSVGPGTLGQLGTIASAVAPATAGFGQTATTGMEGGIPANPYATGPYKAGMRRQPSGINFGG